MPKSPEWTRSVDTGLPWQNPPNAPIFVNIPTVAVWYIIKKASANFRKRTVLYRVPRMETGGENKCIFLFNLAVLIFLICLTVVVGRDRMGLTLVGKIIKNQEDDEDE